MHRIQSGEQSGLQILEIELTNKCNLNCEHCYVKKNKLVDLQEEKVVELIKTAGKMQVYRLVFTGGEPLLYKNIFGLAELAKKVGIKQVMLMTNGLLINKKNISAFKIFDLIQLSIDVPPGEKPHFRKNYFFDLIKKINLLKENNIQVNLQATLHKSLIPLLDEINNFSKELDIKIGINRLFNINSSEKVKSELLCPSELKKGLEKIVELRKKNHLIGCSDPFLFLVDKKRMTLFEKSLPAKIIGGCIAGIATLYIRSNGDVLICPFVEKVFDNIYSSKIESIWFENELLMRIRDRENFSGKCKNCKFLAFCGGCRASALINGGDLFGSDPNCFIT